MKIFSKILSLTLVIALSFTSNVQIAYAQEPAETRRQPLSEYQQLQADIALIEKLSLEDLQEFQEKNEEWLEDVNKRLETYLASISTSKGRQDTALRDLVGSSSVNKAASDYFNWYTYHYRGGYWTYSMQPKMSTRLLRPIAIAGWNQLASIYSGISSDNGSLFNQYMCHFDAFIEADWDIEKGRPYVSYFNTLLAFCNP